MVMTINFNQIQAQNDFLTRIYIVQTNFIIIKNSHDYKFHSNIDFDVKLYSQDQLYNHKVMVMIINFFQILILTLIHIVQTNYIIIKKWS